MSNDTPWQVKLIFYGTPTAYKLTVSQACMIDPLKANILSSPGTNILSLHILIGPVHNSSSHRQSYAASPQAIEIIFALFCFRETVGLDTVSLSHPVTDYLLFCFRCQCGLFMLILLTVKLISSLVNSLVLLQVLHSRLKHLLVDGNSVVLTLISLASFLGT